MKKENSNRRKAAIGAVIAAGMTTGAISVAGAQNAEPQAAETELTAADAVVIDGTEVQMEEVVPQVRDRAKPMYGVRQRPIRLLYGPRPRPRVEQPDPETVIAPSLEDSVKVVVAGVMNVTPDKVKTTSNLVKDLGADMLNMIELGLAVQREFNVTIPDYKLNTITTVAELIDFVRDNKR